MYANFLKHYSQNDENKIEVSRNRATQYSSQLTWRVVIQY